MADKEFAHARCRPPMNLRPYTIAVLLLAVVAGGLPVAAQQAPKIPKVGLFTPSTPVAAAPLVATDAPNRPSVSTAAVAITDGRRIMLGTP